MSAFRKIASKSIARAALTASVSGFLVDSSLSPRNSAVVSENGVCKTTLADGNRFWRTTASSSKTIPQNSSTLKAVNQDHDLDVFVYDMLKMSDFVYSFHSTYFILYILLLIPVSSYDLMTDYILQKPTTAASLITNRSTMLTNISLHASLNADIRNIVRTNNGKKTKKYSFFGEESEVKFFEPQLVITDTGGQERDEN
jgi:hypothetical protein